jgi:hypothetical protein
MSPKGGQKLSLPTAGRPRWRGCHEVTGVDWRLKGRPYEYKSTPPRPVKLSTPQTRGIFRVRSPLRKLKCIIIKHNIIAKYNII